MTNDRMIELLKNAVVDVETRIAIRKALGIVEGSLCGTSHSHTIGAHTHTLDAFYPKANCPRCGQLMQHTGHTPAGMIQCDVHSWYCEDCGITRQQAYDWPYFEPRQWQRVLYSITAGPWIPEDEPEKLKEAISKLPPLPESAGSEPEKVPERILYPEKYCNLCNKALKHQSPPISYYFNNLPLCFECMKIVSAHH